MQKESNQNQNILLTDVFVSKFTNAVNKLYHYPRYMNFFVISSITNQKTLSYAPLLNYTDKTHNNITDLLELAKDNAFQIRTLNFEYLDFKTQDTVSMRLNIDNISSEELFKHSVKPRCRNKVRNSIKKFNFTMKHGNKTQDIEDFYTIFSNTMHKHGTPALNKQLFYNLTKEFEDDILFFNLYDKTKVVASMCIILDKEIAWYPWGGVDIDYTRQLAGYNLYWETLKYICDNTDIKIFDFGRSSYGGSTYQFKSQFGAEAVKIDIISSQETDVYSKYSLASDIWKKLPKSIVDLLGPKLCKYLVDL